MSPQPERWIAAYRGLQHLGVAVGYCKRLAIGYRVGYVAGHDVIVAAAGFVHIPVDNAHVEFSRECLGAGDEGCRVI